MKSFPKHQISTSTGEIVEAQCPTIISCSRATDIPAFYSEWFFKRLQSGYLSWRNPFNGKNTFISFRGTRFIVFWSKNPAPLIPYLKVLKDKGIGCYIHFTLNDYESEGLEPGLPPLSDRIETFKRLTQILGKGAVIWRFDPLILTQEMSIDTLLSKISKIGDKLSGYSEKLVFSFADIASYKNVGKNLLSHNVNYIEWDDKSMKLFASQLNNINIKRWNYELATCAEKVELNQFNIKHNRCINPDLISTLSSDPQLNEYLLSAKRDSGQRKHCGCIKAKDIGQYNTCAHGCTYCYANISPNSALLNYKKHTTTPLSDTII